MLQINHQRRFSQHSDYAAFAAVRIHNSQLGALGGRNAWVYIECDTGGVYRTVRGSGSLPMFPQDGMELDYDTVIELGMRSTAAPSLRPGGSEPPFYHCKLLVRRARKWEMIRAHWNHPNPAYRVPLQISIVLGTISVVLGVIGVVLGAISLI